MTQLPKIEWGYTHEAVKTADESVARASKQHR